MPKGTYKRTQETKDKISIAQKRRDKSTFNVNFITDPIKNRESVINSAEKRRGKPLSVSQRIKISLNNGNKGESSHFWKGGITPKNVKIRMSIEYKLWREAVFARDNFTCQECKKRGIYLEAHHLKSFSDYPELRTSINNGISLCVPCHGLIDKFRSKFLKK